MKTLLRLFWGFFKIGAFTFGGGYAMIPLIKAELVDKRKWIEESDFYDTIAIAQSSTGPLVVNMAVFLGLKIARFGGMVAAALGATLPSFITILLIAILFQNFQHNSYVVATFKGVKPAVVALILLPAWAMAKKSNIKRFKLLIPVFIAAAVAFCGVSPILFIIAAMIIGNLAYGRKK